MRLLWMLCVSCLRLREAWLRRNALAPNQERASGIASQLLPETDRLNWVTAHVYLCHLELIVVSDTRANSCQASNLAVMCQAGRCTHELFRTLAIARPISGKLDSTRKRQERIFAPIGICLYYNSHDSISSAIALTHESSSVHPMGLVHLSNASGPTGPDHMLLAIGS